MLQAVNDDDDIFVIKIVPDDIKTLASADGKRDKP